MERLQQTLEWLYSLEARGEIYKLERMEQALERIGNPHLRLQVDPYRRHQGQRLGGGDAG